jgi:hypothetical protein
LRDPWPGDGNRSGMLRGRSVPEPGVPSPIPPGPREACASSGDPVAPRPGPKPWRFAAWQIRNSRPCSRSTTAPKAEASVQSALRDPRPKPWFRLAVHGPKPWVCRFAAPEPKPGPARQSGQASLPVTLRRLSPRWCRVSEELAFPIYLSVTGPKPGNRWALFEACRFRIR